MNPSFLEAKGSPVFSVMLSASMSARSAMVLPGLPPLISAISPGRLEPAIGNPQFVHFLGDLLCGAELLEARLRMLVKIPAKCHYFRLYSLCHCSKIHIKPSLVLLAAENRYLLFPCKNIAFIVAR